jgi:hypothetical protein
MEDTATQDQPSATTTGIESQVAEELPEFYQEPIFEPEPVLPRKHRPEIIVRELDNPDFAASSAELKYLIAELVEQTHLPSVDMESLHNYFCSMVKGIRQHKISNPNVPPEAKVLVGFADGVLAGLTLFYMLPYRIPHISTMDWPYCISKHARITYKFVQEMLRCKKLWRARYINLVATNDRLVKVYMRGFKKMRIIGTVMIGEGMKDKMIKL